MFKMIFSIIAQAVLSFLGVGLIIAIASMIVFLMLKCIDHTHKSTHHNKYILIYIDVTTGRRCEKTIYALSIQAAHDQAVSFIAQKNLAMYGTGTYYRFDSISRA